MVTRRVQKSIVEPVNLLASDEQDQEQHKPCQIIAAQDPPGYRTS